MITLIFIQFCDIFEKDENKRAFLQGTVWPQFYSLYAVSNDSSEYIGSACPIADFVADSNFAVEYRTRNLGDRFSNHRAAISKFENVPCLHQASVT